MNNQRKKLKQTTDWYRVRKLIEQYDTPYYVIYGERSNGKTYSVLEYIIDEVSENLNNGRLIEFCYVRRNQSDITLRKARTIFEQLDEYCYSKLGSYIQYSHQRGYFIQKDGKELTIGHARSVENAFNDKGVSLPRVQIIMFDEFLDYRYLDDEIRLFQNLISTIVRDRKDVKAFLIGNTVSTFCPYFELFGIDHDKLSHGDAAVVRHKHGVSVTVERCKNRVDFLGQDVKTNKYVGFDNSKASEMILYGEWETKLKNIKHVDGVSWSSMRHLIPVYFVALGDVFEMTIYQHKYPILFVRKINTQNGKVNQKIRCYISYDDSVILYYGKSGEHVPYFRKISRFMGENIITSLQIVKECVSCGRVVYSDMNVGTEFETILENV